MVASRWVLLAATFIAGATTAVQARINGQLSSTIGNGLEAAAASFATGLVIMVVLTCAIPSIRRGLVRLPAAIRSGELAWWQLLGGVLGGFFVAVQSATVPTIGVAVFTVGVVAGQIANSLLVDRAGLGPAGHQPITARRLLSAGLAVVAVAIAVSDRFAAQNLSVIAVVFAVAAGATTAVQAAINGRVSRSAGSPMSAAALNFVFGLLAVSAALGVTWAVTSRGPSALPHGPWWLYLGGVTGVVFIVSAAWVVPKIGVLVFALVSISGQLSGAVILDLVTPTSGSEVVWNLFAGVALAFVAVAISALPRRNQPAVWPAP